MDYFKFTGTEIINGVWQDETLETGSRYSYRDFEAYKGEVTEALKKSLFIRPDFFSGSDYSGSTYTVSNFRTFLKEHKDIEGVYELFGDFGSYAIVIRADVAEENEEIRDTLNALENYPVIDDGDSSAVELEWQQEAMKDIIHDIERDLDKRTDLDEYIPNLTDILEKITTDNTLEQLAYEAIDTLNVEWSYEYRSAYLDADKLIPYIEDVLLIDYSPNLPLFINRDWSCDTTRNRYVEKFSE